MENQPPSTRPTSTFSPRVHSRSPMPLRASNHTPSTNLGTAYLDHQYDPTSPLKDQRQIMQDDAMDPTKSLISPPPEEILRSAERPRHTHSRSSSTSTYQPPKHLRPNQLSSSPTRTITPQAPYSTLSVSKRKRGALADTLSTASRSALIPITASEDRPIPLSVENTPNPKPRKISKHHPRSTSNSFIQYDEDASMQSPTRPSGRSPSLQPRNSSHTRPSSPSKQVSIASSNVTNTDYFLPTSHAEFTKNGGSDGPSFNLLSAPLSHRRRSRSATPIPHYEPPPREQYTPPRYIVLSTPSISKSAKRKSVVPKSIAKLKADADARVSVSISTKLRAKGKATAGRKLHIKTEPPEVNLNAPIPPPSPTDDPLLLTGRPRRPKPKSGPVLEGQPRHISPSLASTSPASARGSVVPTSVERARRGWGSNESQVHARYRAEFSFEDDSMVATGVDHDDVPISLFNTGDSWSDSGDDDNDPITFPSVPENGAYDYQVPTKGSPLSGFTNESPSFENHAFDNDTESPFEPKRNPSVDPERYGNGSGTVGDGVTLSQIEAHSERRRRSVSPFLPRAEIALADDSRVECAEDEDAADVRSSDEPMRSLGPEPATRGEYGGGLTLSQLEAQKEHRRSNVGLASAHSTRRGWEQEIEGEDEMNVPHSGADDSRELEEEEIQPLSFENSFSSDGLVVVNGDIDNTRERTPEEEAQDDADEAHIDRALSQDPELDPDCEDGDQPGHTPSPLQDSERYDENADTSEFQNASVQFESIRAKFFNSGNNDPSSGQQVPASPSPLAASIRPASLAPTPLRSIAELESNPVVQNHGSPPQEPRSRWGSKVSPHSSMFSPTSKQPAFTPSISKMTVTTPSVNVASPLAGLDTREERESEYTPLSSYLFPARRVPKPFPSFSPVVSQPSSLTAEQTEESQVSEAEASVTLPDAEHQEEVNEPYHPNSQFNVPEAEAGDAGDAEVAMMDVNEDEDDTGDDSLNSIDPSVVSITSNDPKAAARAAAILKLYDYDMLPHIRLQFERNARRKTVSSSGVTKAITAEREKEKRHREKEGRRAKLGGVQGDLVILPGEPVMTLPQLLREAEVELEREGSISGSVASSPSKTRSRGTTPLPFLEHNASATFGGRESYQTPSPVSPRKRTLSGPIDVNALRSQEWTRTHWKLLDSCFTDQRIIRAEELGMRTGELADVDEVDLEAVIEAFLRLLDEIVDLSELGEEWTRDMILHRVLALQKKQAAGSVAPPTPSGDSSFSRIHLSSPASSVPDFTPMRFPPSMGRLPPPAVDHSTPFASFNVTPRMPAPLFAPRYSHLIDEAINIRKNTRSTTSTDSPTEGSVENLDDASEDSYLDESRSVDSECRELPSQPSSMAKRMKGFFTSYLPIGIKSTPGPKKPLHPQHPGLPLPPPEILNRQRGPVATPIPKELEKVIPHKELVDLNHIPLPKPSLIPRVVSRPRRLVDLNHIEPPAPVLRSKAIPIRRRSSSSSSSVKDLVRGFEQLDEGTHPNNNRSSKMLYQSQSVTKWFNGMSSTVHLTNKPAWKP